MKGSQVTIKDIARELNISPSTVSRALKDHPDISNDTKKAVTDLAAKWNYQPNTIAMGLRQNKTNTIGVIIPELVHFFFSTVISGIEDVAYSGGYSVIVSQSGENLEREALDIQTMFNHRVDGILMSVTKETDHFEHIGAIFDRGMPMVFFDRVIDSIACSKVVVDDFEGGYQATAHLIKQGYTRIAHLAGPEKLHIARQRLAGYKKALMDHGLGIDESMIFFEDFRGDESCAREITLEMLDKRNPPQAIFANNDMAALGVMAAAKSKGLKIPGDIGIVGFSNWNFTALTEPPLTTVNQPGFEMGREAARLLIREIEAGDDHFVEPETIILKTELIIRESSVR